MQGGSGRISGDKRLTEKDVFATRLLPSQQKNVLTFEEKNYQKTFEYLGFEVKLTKDTKK